MCFIFNVELLLQGTTWTTQWVTHLACHSWAVKNFKNDKHNNTHINLLHTNRCLVLGRNVQHILLLIILDVLLSTWAPNMPSVIITFPALFVFKEHKIYVCCQFAWCFVTSPTFYQLSTKNINTHLLILVCIWHSCSWKNHSAYTDVRWMYLFYTEAKSTQTNYSSL